MVHYGSEALVVVDAQEGFFNDHSRGIIPTLVQLMDSWIASGRPLILTRYLNYPESPFNTLLGWPRLQEPPETDLAQEVSERADDAIAVIDKYGYSCFTEEFQELARQGGWKDIYFCGVATESCVLKSAVDAFELGYIPRIVTDASSSDAGENVHKSGLVVARRLIGARHLVTTEQVLASFEVPHSLPSTPA